jgi:hypothetical protein
MYGGGRTVEPIMEPHELQRVNAAQSAEQTAMTSATGSIGDSTSRFKSARSDGLRVSDLHRFAHFEVRRLAD